MIKKYLVLFFFLIFFIFNQNLRAQSFHWAKKGGGSSPDYSKAIAVDEAGNSYITGYFSGTAVFDSETISSAGGEDVLVAKYHPDGTLGWLKRAGSPFHDDGYGIVLDKWNNVYVTGIYDVLAVFDADSVYGGTMFVTKFDSSGKVLWASSATANIPFGISVDSIGNAYVAGDYYTRAYFDSDTLFSKGKADIFVAKYAPNGKVLWTKSAGGKQEDYAYGISTDRAGNSYVTGYFSDTAAFGTQKCMSAGNEDVFVSKLDPNGNFLWTRSIGSTKTDKGYGTVIDKDGMNCYITGSFNDSLFFNGIKLLSSGMSDIYIAQCDSSGKFVWAKSAGGSGQDYGYAIGLDGMNNSYITGHYNDTAAFGAVSIQGNNMYIAKYSASGNTAWAKGAGGGVSDEGRGIATDGSANVYFTGSFNAGTAWFDSIQLSSNELDVFVAKLKDFPTAIVENSTRENKLKLYPNPAQDFLRLELADLEVNKTEVSIYNVLGQKMYYEIDRTESKNFLKELAINHLPPGIYNLIMINGVQVFFKRFVKR
jgi:hypothetical protein